PAQRPAARGDPRRAQPRLHSLGGDRGRVGVLVAGFGPGNGSGDPRAGLPDAPGPVPLVLGVGDPLQPRRRHLVPVSRSEGGGGMRAEVVRAEVAEKTATREGFWAQFRKSKQGMIGLGVLGVFVLLALCAPLIADPDQLNAVAARSAGNPQWARPSEFPPLGTDHLRRSVWAQFVWGSRISLFVGVAATAVTMVIGSA